MRRLLVVGVAVLALAAAGCGGGNEYPEAAEDEFMTSCLTQAGASATGCRCTFERLEDEFSYEELQQAEVAIVTGRQPPEDLAKRLVEVVEGCLD